MKALCVDDETITLALLKRAVEASDDIDEVYAFEEETPLNGRKRTILMWRFWILSFTG